MRAYVRIVAFGSEETGLLQMFTIEMLATWVEW